MLPINKTVWIISSKKTDGRYNKGKVKGIDLFYNGLGYMSETQYLKDFEEWRYKVAYVDVFTNRACQEWIHHKELSVTKPKDVV